MLGKSTFGNFNRSLQHRFQELNEKTGLLKACATTKSPAFISGPVASYSL